MVSLCVGERYRCCQWFVYFVLFCEYRLIRILLGLTGKKEGKTRLMNMVMQLRKVTCHPYLFDGAVSRVPTYILNPYLRCTGTGPALYDGRTSSRKLWQDGHSGQASLINEGERLSCSDFQSNESHA